jgi:hypothetical protein
MTMYDDSRVVTLLREIEPPVGPPDRLSEVTRRARRSESKRASALAGVMAVVLAAGVISAVNLGNRGTTEVLSVAGAAKATTAAGSARLTLRITLSGSTRPELPDGDLMTLSGPIDFRKNRYRLVGAFTKQPWELRGIGRDTWMKSDFYGALGGGKPWTHSRDDMGVKGFGAAEPTRLLAELTKKGRELSRKQVGDRTVVVIRISSDLFNTVTGAKNSPVDMTVEYDDDGRIRKMSSTQQTPFGTTTGEYRYDDFGIEVDVQPPPADQVQESASSGSSSGSVTQTVPLTGTGSEADRKRACEQFRSFVKNRPAPKTDQERQQQAQFDEAIAQACD